MPERKSDADDSLGCRHLSSLSNCRSPLQVGQKCSANPSFGAKILHGVTATWKHLGGEAFLRIAAEKPVMSQNLSFA